MIGLLVGLGLIAGALADVAAPLPPGWRPEESQQPSEACKAAQQLAAQAMADAQNPFFRFQDDLTGRSKIEIAMQAVELMRRACAK